MTKKRFIKVLGLLLVVGLLFAAAPTKQALAQTAGVDQSVQAAADRVVELQRADGGWGWPLTYPEGTPSAQNILGVIGKGLAEAYLFTNDPDHLAALDLAGDFLLAKTSFSATDYEFAMKLDEIFGVTTYTAYVKANYYDQLALGTYTGKTGGPYSTQTYVNAVRAGRAGTQANMAAWDMGMLVASAVNAGVAEPDLTIWMDGLKAEINELYAGADQTNYLAYDVIGLAGAVYGLAVAGVDFDPTAGEHAAASSTSDLAAILASYQINGGGFAWNKWWVIPDDFDEDMQATSYAMLALSAFNKTTYWEQINGAARYARSIQLANGGWYTDEYFDEENVEVDSEILWGITQASAALSIVPVGGTTYCGPEAGTTMIDVLVQDLPAGILQGYSVVLDLPTGVTITDAENGNVLNGSIGISDPVIYGGNEVHAYAMGDSLSTQAGILVTITLSHPVDLSALTVGINAGTILSDADAYVIPTGTMTGTTITRGIAIVQNAASSAYFCDLQEAVTAAAPGQTLNVLRNFAADATVDITKQLTFNTATYTVSFTPATGYYTPILWVKAGGNLTINGTGTLNSVTVEGNGAAVRVSEGGDLTLDGATLAGGYSSLRIDGNRAPGGDERAAIDSTFTMTSGTLADGFAIFGKGAEATIKGGLVQSETEYAAITGNGINNTAENNSGTKITINGGSVRNAIDAAIFHPQDGDLIITGGEVWGATGIIMKSGNLDISGPSHIYADGVYAEPIVAGSGQNSTGDAILIYGGTGYTGDITVNVHINEWKDFGANSGQLTSENGYAIREFSNTSTDTRTSSVKISSGAIQSVFGEWGMLPTAENILFTEALRDKALADLPNDTLLLTGGWYNMDPAYYVFPPLETYPEYEVPGDTNSALGFRIREQLAVTNANLLSSTAIAGPYAPVTGTFAGGFTMVLDPTVPWYYFDTTSITSNRLLKDGSYSFALSGTTAEVFTLVVSGNGTEFFLRDTYANNGTPLRVAGNDPLGTFTFEGEVEDVAGSKDTVSLTITFVAPLAVTDANLLSSTAIAGPYAAVPGTFAGGFTMVLDPAVPWYYFDTTSITSNRPLADGSYSFALSGTTAEVFTLVVSGNGTEFFLRDTYANNDTPLRVAGNDPLGTFTFVGQVADSNGFTDEVSLTITFVAPLAVTNANLLSSTAIAGPYAAVPGTFTGGFTMVLDPAVQWYYFDTTSITSNRPLADGSYSFHNTLAPTQEVFTLVVSGNGTEFFLRDTYANNDTPLRVAGNDPLGTFTFVGQVADANGFTDEVSLTITFVAPLAVTDADLFYSTDPANITTPMGGSYGAGFALQLDPSVPWYYLDTNSITTNNTLANGSYPFYIAGVTDPIFYVKVDGTTLLLIDGWQYQHGLGELPLRINGDYSAGTYTYTGSLTDIYGTSATGTIKITLTRAIISSVTGTISMQGRSTRAGVQVTLTGNFGYGPYEDTSDDLVSNNLSFANLGLGEYTITTLQPRYLNVTADLLKKINVVGPYNMSALILKGGNAYWRVSESVLDNIINSSDSSIVGTQYGSSGADAGFGNHGDCNFDGIVNIQDLALVGGNWSLTSAAAYSGTLPWVP